MTLKYMTMNEKIDLTKILKDCPTGTKLYSTIFGEVKFMYIDTNNEYKIICEGKDGMTNSVTSNGKYRFGFNGECTLFPSKDQRDWSKFTAPWYKKEKFDPNTLKPFDKVLGRDADDRIWKCNLFSHINKNTSFPYRGIGGSYIYCIPYNDDTKHLVGTIEEAPEYYRYWED